MKSDYLKMIHVRVYLFLLSWIKKTELNYLEQPFAISWKFRQNWEERDWKLKTGGCIPVSPHTC